MLFELQKGTLDGADSGGGDIAIFRGVLLGVLRHPVEHGAQILQIIEQQTALVGNAEHDIEDTILRLVQLEKTGKQLRSHL